MPHNKAHEKKKYRLTTISCFVGIFTQAIITNLTAILFIPLMRLYDLNYVHLGILVGINFTTQVLADILFSGLIDKIGFRRIALPTCVMSVVGLLLFGLTPYLFPQHIFVGLVISTIIFAFSGGLLEIILSPIIDAIPNEDKGPAMSLMHSFYAWGQVVTIVVTTLYLFVADVKFWTVIVFVWALVPLCCFILFYKSAMPPNAAEHLRLRVGELLKNRFNVTALFAILFGGATEVVMNQWASTFINDALQIPKVTGDLLGMCGFSVMLGLGRTLYGKFGGKINLQRVLVLGSGISVFCYVVVALSPMNGINIVACAVTGFFCSLLWPGVIVVSSARFPTAGAMLFALLAAAGDIGAGVGPYFTGIVTERIADFGITRTVMRLYHTTSDGAVLRLGILFAVVFPLMAFLCHVVISRMKRAEISS